MSEYSSSKLYMDVIQSFLRYQEFCEAKLDIKKLKFKKLPEHQKPYIFESYYNRLSIIENCIKANQIFLTKIAANSANMLGNVCFNEFSNGPLTEHKHIYTIMKQIYREWSEEGVTERKASFDRIIDLFCELFDEESRQKATVLIPGAGLGRLVCELAERGSYCIYNEDDMNMIVASHGFMNNMFGDKKFTIYPWLDDWCNNYGSEKMIRPVKVPDFQVNPNAKMIALGGDFFEIFDEQYFNTLDCIVTCFFIDTSNNVISCIEKIHLLLKPRGIWINLGPLVYHHADNPNCCSIEPTFQELKHIILECLNFDLVKPIEFIDCTYFENCYSMHRYYYNCPFFAVRK